MMAFVQEYLQTQGLLLRVGLGGSEGVWDAVKGRGGNGGFGWGLWICGR